MTGWSSAHSNGEEDRATLAISAAEPRCGKAREVYHPQRNILEYVLLPVAPKYKPSHLHLPQKRLTEKVGPRGQQGENS